MNTVLSHFYNLLKIPHESGNETGVVLYLENFAKKNNLDFYKDNFNNVLIKTKIQNKKTLILQSHTDMVCVKEEQIDFNFFEDEILTKVDGLVNGVQEVLFFT